MTQPLDDILVLDFSTLLPGPMATLMLAEAGAEVIKLERPVTGEDMRLTDPKIDGRSSLAKAGPEETTPSSNGPTVVPFINQMVGR